MRWTPGGSQADIEEGSSRGGGFGGLPIGGGGLGCGGVVILLVLSLIFHKNFFALFDQRQTQQAPAAGPQQPGAAPGAAPTDERREFAVFVINDVQSTWDKLLPQETNEQYHHAKLHFFTDAVDSACGSASSASGPFYCPLDERIYLDRGFFDELRERFGAPGDFGAAYVIAHEAGHHVQHILGISDKVHQAQEDNPRNANELSVRLELQADCLAGVWGHSAQQRNLLEAGDVEEGLNAAAAVGDDRIQRMAGRAVNPEKWTHGSAQERSTWFRRGFESGHVASCDTFGR